jgi:hypothetical protein
MNIRAKYKPREHGNLGNVSPKVCQEISTTAWVPKT